MSEPKTPQVPTTLIEWTKAPTFREQLSTAVRQPFMVGAVAVLRNMNAPKALASPDLAAGALCHQYHAGWEACIKALLSLPGFDDTALSRMQKAATLEAVGPWSYAGTPEKK